jgi:bacterioferritin
MAPRDEAVVEALNELLTAELTAVNQYFVHAKLLQSWGYEHLAKAMRDASIDEMKDAEILMERILTLDGLPNLQRLGNFHVGETPVEQLTLSLETEDLAAELMRKVIDAAEEHRDPATSALIGPMLLHEEDQAGWLRSQLELAEQLGESTYLAQQIRE